MRTAVRDRGIGATRGESLYWAMAGQAAFAITGFCSSIMFARLTGPDTYGRYVLALTMVACTSIAFDFCVVQCLITAPQFDEALAAGWSFLSVALASIASIVLLVVNTMVPSLHFPILGAVALALFPPLNAASMASRAHALRLHRQRHIAITDAASGLIAAVATTLLLLLSDSFSSLCAYIFVSAFVKAAGLAPFHPRLSQGWVRLLPTHLRQLRHAARGAYALQLMSFASRNMDNLAIGWLLGARALAFYSRGYGLLIGPLTQAQISLTSPGINALRAGRVTFASLSWTLNLLIVPLSMFFAVFAHDVVGLLLGPEWQVVATIMPFFAVSASVMAVGIPCRWILQSGRLHNRMRVDALLQVLPIMAAVVGAYIGDVVLAVIAMSLVATPLVLLVECILVWPVLRGKVVVLLIRMLGLAAVSGGVFLSAAHAPSQQDGYSLVLGSVCLALIMLTAWRAAPRFAEFKGTYK